MSQIHFENSEKKHPKQDFQVERIAFFSDAVFAIALTLLILEFKVPRITNETTPEELWQEIAALRFNLFSLLLSFMLTSAYWMRHHFLFKHIHNYNKQTVIANLMVLLTIIFFPFSTALLAESFDKNNVYVSLIKVVLQNPIHLSLLILHATE